MSGYVNHHAIPGPGDSLPPYSRDDGYDVWFERRSEDLFNEYRADRDRVEEVVAQIDTWRPLAGLLLANKDDVEMLMDRFVYALTAEVDARVRIQANEAADTEWELGPTGPDEYAGGQLDA